MAQYNGDLSFRKGDIIKVLDSEVSVSAFLRIYSLFSEMKKAGVLEKSTGRQVFSLPTTPESYPEKTLSSDTKPMRL